MGTHSLVGCHNARPHEDAFFSAHGYTKVPALVQWMVTGRCELSCPHCLSSSANTMPELERPQVERLLDDIAAMGVDELLLTGGEPAIRSDLYRIVDMLGTRGIRWSLNTALMPDERTQRAMKKWPPCFVAVSLDGPAPIHDRIRGPNRFAQAMAAIRFYSDIAENGVAAGTTVTRLNFDALFETFLLAAASGATRWGLHLLVPEGRAATRRGLELSPSRLRELLRFAATMRHYFPVDLADEIGFVGSYEPLVRDEPFFCGAGRAGCVILPNGDVVPCTTMDRSTSAGNIANRGLQKIWRDGFRALREWNAEGKCKTCSYAPACRGGCWLQRKNGVHCYKAVWDKPSGAKAAAVLLGIGLGLGSLTAAESVAFPNREYASEVIENPENIQRAIVLWYAMTVNANPAADKHLIARLGDSPGKAARYVLSFIRNRHHRTLAQRTTAIRAALETRQRSLCLLGLAWRDLAEWIFGAPSPDQRSADQNALLRKTMVTLGETAEVWRRDVLEQRLDPFLRDPEAYRRFFRSKAGPPVWLRVHGPMSNKRGWSNPKVSNTFLKAHPHAEHMDLTLAPKPGCRTEVFRAGVERKANTLGVFDTLCLDADEACPLSVQLGNHTFDVHAPTGTVLTYPDLLNLVYQENAERVGALYQNLSNARSRAHLPFLLPFLYRELRQLEKSPARNAEELRKMHWWMTDILLF